MMLTALKSTLLASVAAVMLASSGSVAKADDDADDYWDSYWSNVQYRWRRDRDWDHHYYRSPYRGYNYNYGYPGYNYYRPYYYSPGYNYYYPGYRYGYGSGNYFYYSPRGGFGFGWR